MNWDWISPVHELSRSGEPFVLVTICSAQGSTPREVGAKMVVTAQRVLGTIGGGGVELQAVTHARVLLEGGRTCAQKFALVPEKGHACGGTVEVLYEVQGSTPDVYVFGVGHVGQALCQVLEGTPVRVHAVDERLEWIEHPGLPATTHRHHGAFSDFVSRAPWDEKRTYAVILTWSHERDAEILEAVVDKPLRYLGLIGSRRKAEEFRKKLHQKGTPPHFVERVRCPMGLFVGGKSPKEVAVSVAAEILAMVSELKTEDSK